MPQEICPFRAVFFDIFSFYHSKCRMNLFYEAEKHREYETDGTISYLTSVKKNQQHTCEYVADFFFCIFYYVYSFNQVRDICVDRVRRAQAMRGQACQ